MMMTSEDAWREFVEDYEIDVPEDSVENEMNFIMLDMRHRMQYDTLTGGAPHVFADMELEQQKDEIYQTAYFETKSDLVMKAVLKEHDFPVTREELEAEAEAMAKRQNTTLEMIRSFFGEELAMLERDIRERKAREWVCDLQNFSEIS